MQVVNAGPAPDGGELQVVAQTRLPLYVLQMQIDQSCVLAKVAAVDVAGNAARVALAEEALRGGHFPRDPWMRWNHDHAGRGSGQDQASAARPTGAGELLGGPAAPGDPENVGLRMSIVVEDRCREPRNSGHSIRAIRQRRGADARDVERDDFALGHPARDWLEQLDVAADPV